jgi:hypothetical protein
MVGGAPLGWYQGYMVIGPFRDQNQNTRAGWSVRSGFIYSNYGITNLHDIQIRKEICIFKAIL